MVKRSLCSTDAPVRGNAAGAFSQKNGVKRAVSFMALLFLAVLMAFSAASAEVLAAEDMFYPFDTKGFDVMVKVKKNHVISVEENIKTYFNIPKHGIYRYIPERMKFYSVKNIHVPGDNYETDFEVEGEDKDGTYGNWITIIGDEYRYIEGDKDY